MSRHVILIEHNLKKQIVLVFAMLPALMLLPSVLKRSKLTYSVFLHVVDRKNF